MIVGILSQSSLITSQIPPDVAELRPLNYQKMAALSGDLITIEQANFSIVGAFVTFVDNNGSHSIFLIFMITNHCFLVSHLHTVPSYPLCTQL